jgi:hypothetical protein
MVKPSGVSGVECHQVSSVCMREAGTPDAMVRVHRTQSHLICFLLLFSASGSQRAPLPGQSYPLSNRMSSFLSPRRLPCARSVPKCFALIASPTLPPVVGVLWLLLLWPHRLRALSMVGNAAYPSPQPLCDMFGIQGSATHQASCEASADQDSCVQRWLEGDMKQSAASCLTTATRQSSKWR